VTASDPREGKPLKAVEPHGRYRVKAPERSAEEEVAEVVENGVSGTTAGVGKPVPVDSTDSMRRRGRKPRRGAPRGQRKLPESGPAWIRVTEEATNLKRDVQTAVDSFGGGRGAREYAEGRRREAQGRGRRGRRPNEVSSARHEALKRR
jgi:hypothetical protein